MEAFLWGLLATAIISVGVAAWQKPDFFNAVISPWLARATTVLAVLVCIWQAGATYTRSTIVKLIPDLSIDLLMKIQSATDLPAAIWLGVVGFAIYHAIWSSIAKALVKHQSKQDK